MSDFNKTVNAPSDKGMLMKDLSPSELANTVIDGIMNDTTNRKLQQLNTYLRLK